MVTIATINIATISCYSNKQKPIIVTIATINGNYSNKQLLMVTIATNRQLLILLIAIATINGCYSYHCINLRYHTKYNYIRRISKPSFLHS